MRYLEGYIIIFVFIIFVSQIYRIVFYREGRYVEPTNIDVFLAWLDSQGYLRKWIYLKQIGLLNQTLIKFIGRPFILEIYNNTVLIDRIKYGSMENYYQTTYFLPGYNGSIKPLILILKIGG
ncbi:MAG: hypothetical protein DRJ34_02580 [Thermoprotei archaeon]|nr:MAG: hypothetical protein DRJ34_02580 [Thermoprotei archaeon]